MTPKSATVTNYVLQRSKQKVTKKYFWENDASKFAFKSFKKQLLKKQF